MNYGFGGLSIFFAPETEGTLRDSVGASSIFCIFWASASKEDERRPSYRQTQRGVGYEQLAQPFRGGQGTDEKRSRFPLR